MNIKNFLRKALSPKDTEELKPGFFVQTRYKNILNEQGNIIAREPHHYRKIEPIVWDEKYRWKVQMKTIFCFRTLFTIAIILFVAWNYVSDKQGYKEFFDEVTTNPMAYCDKIYQLYSNENLDKKDGEQNTFTLQDYPE